MLVVVVENSVQGGGTQIQKGVVSRLLLLPTCVAIEEIVDLVRYFWGGQTRQINEMTYLHNVNDYVGRQICMRVHVCVCVNASVHAYTCVCYYLKNTEPRTWRKVAWVIHFTFAPSGFGFLFCKMKAFEQSISKVNFSSNIRCLYPCFLKLQSLRPKLIDEYFTGQCDPREAGGREMQLGRGQSQRKGVHRRAGGWMCLGTQWVL